MSSFLLLLAEKGGYGHEEGWYQGPDDDDIVFGGSFHHPVCIGLLDLIMRAKSVCYVCT